MNDTAPQENVLDPVALSDLTMVMMTGNRPRMFRLVMERYAEMAPDLQIIVADFSDEATQRVNRAVAERFPSAVRYVRYAPGTPLRDRFPAVFQLCETQYTVMAPDDDLVLTDGLAASVKFLQDHPDYAACHGIYYEVRPSPAGDSLMMGLQSGFVGRSHDSDDPIGRLMSLMFWYTPIYYAVQRTDAMRNLVIPPVRATAIAELYLAAVVAISGKVARLRLPYFVRNQNPTEQLSSLVALTDVVLLGMDGFSDEYRLVRRLLVERCRAAFPNDPRDWGRLVDIGFTMSVRQMFDVAYVWKTLAMQGDLPAADVPALGGAGMEAETFQIPADYLLPLLTPMLQGGWPSYG